MPRPLQLLLAGDAELLVLGTHREVAALVPGVIDLEDTTTLRLALAEALRKLPRRQREAVALRFLSDLSEADTAEALGISAGSVKTHVHRGLATLRDELGDDRLEAVGV